MKSTATEEARSKPPTQLPRYLGQIDISEIIRQTRRSDAMLLIPQLEKRYCGKVASCWWRPGRVLRVRQNSSVHV